MSLTAEQIQTCKDVVAVFETGRAGGGDPSAVALLTDHAGLSYGTHQATDAGGSLDAILVEYADRGGRWARELSAYLPRLAANASASPAAGSWVLDLTALLRLAGREDPVMRAAQEAVFDRVYWAPTADQCTRAGLVLPLSWAVAFDTAVQSGPAAIARMRALFPQLPPARGGDERAWARAYIGAREAWLAAFVGRDGGHSAAVRRTVYRTRALMALADAGSWDLRRPVRLQLPSGPVVLEPR